MQKLVFVVTPARDCKDGNYTCAVRRMSYKMGSVSSFWCHICACKFMPAYINQAILTVGMGVGDYLKYSPVAAKILLLCWENVKKDFKKGNVVLKRI